MIPPIVDGAATIRDMDNTLSIICYWVIPYTVLGIAGAVSATFPPWFDRRSAEINQAHRDSPRGHRPARAAAGSRGRRADHRRPGREPAGRAVRAGRRPVGEAGSTVEVSTSGNDLFGRSWRSRAAFTVPTNGIVDLSVVPPHGIDGQDPDWSAADGTAPIWAMRFDDEGKTPEMFVPPAEPWQLTVDARGSGHIASTRAVPLAARSPGGGPCCAGWARLVCGSNPSTLGICPGCSSCLLVTHRPSGWPGVACFCGSEGGFESQLSNAAVLASRGFAAFAAPWISEAEAAVNISEVPLERFGASLAALAGHPAVDGGNVSRDRDLPRRRGFARRNAAAGSVPPLRAMVLVSPSCVAWQALGSSGEVPDTGSWTVAGSPVPWVPLASGVLMRQIVRNAWTVGRDIAHQRPTLLRLRPAYENSLVAVGLLARRRFRVLGAVSNDGAPGPSAAGPPAGSPVGSDRARVAAGGFGAGCHQGAPARC